MEEYTLRNHAGNAIPYKNILSHKTIGRGIIVKKVQYVIGICVLIFLVTATAFASTNIKIFINGQQAVSKVSPILQNGSVLVPLRFVSEQLGMNVNWDNQTKTVSINQSKNNPFGSIQVGYDEVTVGTPLDVDFYAAIDNVAYGSHQVQILVRNPSGKVIASKSFSSDVVQGDVPYFYAEDTFNTLNIDTPGIYWVELQFDGKFLNKSAIYA